MNEINKRNHNRRIFIRSKGLEDEFIDSRKTPLTFIADKQLLIEYITESIASGMEDW